MAKKALIQKWSKSPKFPTRNYNRCHICGKPHATHPYMGNFRICHICFRKLLTKSNQ